MNDVIVIYTKPVPDLLCGRCNINIPSGSYFWMIHDPHGIVCDPCSNVTFNTHNYDRAMKGI